MDWQSFWAPNLTQWIIGGAITAIVGAVVGFVVRRWLRQLGTLAVNAAVASQAAAESTSDDRAHVNQVVSALTAQLGATTQQLGETQEARTREADKNDRVLAALLNSMSDSRDLIRWIKQQELPSRVRELENFAADRETEEHITGRLRLHEVAPLTHEQDHT